MKGSQVLVQVAVMVCCLALFVACPVNPPPRLNVIEPTVSKEVAAVDPRIIAQAGFIRQPAITPAGRIATTRKQRTESFAGDRVMVRPAEFERMAAGDRFVTFRLMRPPVIDERYPVNGWHHYLTGVVEIERDWSGLFEASVVEAYRGISENDQLMPISEIDSTFAGQTAPIGISGHILGSEERSETFTKDAVVFLDRGTVNGVEKGQTFNVYRTRRVEEDTVFFNVGSLVVLRAENETATALVLHSETELCPGFLFMNDLKEAGLKTVSTP